MSSRDEHIYSRSGHYRKKVIIGSVILAKGEYLPVMSEREKKKMYFVGDVKAPIAIGNKGALMSLVDDEFFNLYEQYRWFKSGMKSLDIDRLPAYTAIGLRAFCEVKHG